MNTTRTTYTVQRYVRDETNDYGKAGEVEWHVVDKSDDYCVDVYPLRRMAKARADALNNA